MNIGGLLKLTTIDYPDKLSAVIFTQGCPLRCPYCHNPQMQDASIKTDVSWYEVLDFLKTRQKLLDAVVFSGGEPLLQEDIEEAILQVKKLGFLIGLHTSAAYPKKLAQILPMIDWIGLDVKAIWNKYSLASGTSEAFEMGKKAKCALEMILASGVSFEVRTTTDPRVVSKQDILQLAEELSLLGVKNFALQEYRPSNNGIMPEPTDDEIKSFYNDRQFEGLLRAFFPQLILRQAE